MCTWNFNNLQFIDEMQAGSLPVPVVFMIHIDIHSVRKLKTLSENIFDS